MSISTDVAIGFVSTQEVEWNGYVRQHPYGTIFHTAEMVDVFRETPNYRPLAIAAKHEGKIVALLTSVQIKTLRNMAGMASRSICYSEPICDDNEVGRAAVSDLLEQHDREMSSRNLFAEIRSINGTGPTHEPLLRSGYRHLDYIDFVIDLTPGAAAIWDALPKKMRQKIRSSSRKGITVVDDTSTGGVERLYSLLRYSYGRTNVPLADPQMFHAALRILPPGTVRIRTAYDGDQPVASIMSLIYGGRIFSWYGGTLRIAGRSPFASIVWDDIAWGCENGQSLFDFGGGGWPNKAYGPRQFKASFGSNEIRFGRYRKTYAPLRLQLAKFAYKITQRAGAWSNEVGDKASFGGEIVQTDNG